jgi:hypothetical protein
MGARLRIWRVQDEVGPLLERGGEVMKFETHAMAPKGEVSTFVAPLLSMLTQTVVMTVILELISLARGGGEEAELGVGVGRREGEVGQAAALMETSNRGGGGGEDGGQRGRWHLGVWCSEIVL